jgi:hypothetical protein
MHVAGITAEPDVSYTLIPLTRSHHLGIIAATDGLWDNLSFSNVIDSVSSFRKSCDADAAVQHLYSRLSSPIRSRVAAAIRDDDQFVEPASPAFELYHEDDDDYTRLGEESSGVEDDCTIVMMYLLQEPASDTDIDTNDDHDHDHEHGHDHNAREHEQS